MELYFAELIFAGTYFRGWPNFCNFAKLIFAGKLFCCSFADLIFAVFKKIQYFCIFFRGFGAYISLLQIYAIYIFKNVQFCGTNFRGNLDFACFRGI